MRSASALAVASNLPVNSVMVWACSVNFFCMPASRLVTSLPLFRRLGASAEIVGGLLLVGGERGGNPLQQARGLSLSSSEFDDGFQRFGEQALLVLLALGQRATFALLQNSNISSAKAGRAVGDGKPIR